MIARFARKKLSTRTWWQANGTGTGIYSRRYEALSKKSNDKKTKEYWTKSRLFRTAFCFCTRIEESGAERVKKGQTDDFLRFAFRFLRRIGRITAIYEKFFATGAEIPILVRSFKKMSFWEKFVSV